MELGKTKIADLELKDEYKALLTYLWQARRFVDCVNKFDGTPRDWGGMGEFRPSIVMSESTIYKFLQKGVKKGWLIKAKVGGFTRYRLKRELFEL